MKSWRRIWTREHARQSSTRCPRPQRRRRLDELLSDAELLRAAQSGDDEALRAIIRRVMSTGEGQRLAQMLGDAMK